jgi:ABC-type protease/lipase transport system fused ATPase/permease subunit
LPSGYDTPHSVAEQTLPASTLQLIALARAIYDRPKLVILDDPNAHLDLDGEKALSTCISAIKGAGSTVVILTHRANLFELADTLVVLEGGAVKAVGPRGQVLDSLARSAAQHAANRPTLAVSR